MHAGRLGDLLAISQTTLPLSTCLSGTRLRDGIEWIGYNYIVEERNRNWHGARVWHLQSNEKTHYAGCQSLMVVPPQMQIKVDVAVNNTQQQATPVNLYRRIIFSFIRDPHFQILSQKCSRRSSVASCLISVVLSFS